MISSISIHNLKSIADMDIECRALNVFVGANSSGKSTAIQSLLLAAQNLNRMEGLNGELADLGNYDEIHCKQVSASEPISITVADESYSIEYSFSKDDGRTILNIDYDNMSDSLERSLNYPDRYFQYLSCSRIGPQNTYNENMSLSEQIGINGEYAVAFLYQHKSDLLTDDLCRYRNDYTLGGQVNWWLKYITGAEISTSEVPEAHIVIATYTNGELSNIRPCNIGAGISYVISILVAGLSSREGSTLVIENPEIHLHPGAQSRLCEFLYFIAINGIQIFVETHSDHIFNGFRSGIADGTMNKENIAIDSFALDEKEYLSNVTMINIGPHGRILNQQKGLFDQFDKDLNRMLGLGVK